ncbi:MAG: TolC family protein [Gemmatimonadota bacterium]|nr:TolC family protein [Gemmatimonadota bacterium]
MYRFLVGLLFVALVPGPLQAQERPTVRIGIVVDGHWARNAEGLALLERELTDLLRSEFTVEFPASAQLEADWTLAGVRAATTRLLQDPSIDLVITSGVIGSVDAVRRGALPKPVIAPYIPDAALLGVPEVDGGSGIPNLVYITHPTQVLREIQAFREVVEFQHLVILTNPYYLEAVPELRQRLDEAMRAVEMRATLLPLAEVNETTLARLPDDADAVFLAWLTNLQEGETERLLTALRDRALPTLSFFIEDVPRGALMSLNGESYFPRIARRVALNAQRILLGEEAAAIPVEFARDEELTINMETARAIGVFPSFSVLTEATLINEVRQSVAREVTLESVMREAVDANLQLAAQQRAAAAGEKDVTLARSTLLPQVDLRGHGLIVDADRAAASFGAQPQRSLTGGVSGTQLLFAEGAWANLSIQGSVQRAREYSVETLELDIAAEAAVAYLNLLRAKTFERIQRENLDVTRSNLDLARVRVTLGSASPGEVFRWDAQVANGRQAVITANSQRNVAEIDLNRIVRRPLEEPFIPREATMDDLPLMRGTPSVHDYIENPYSFRVFRAFMVEEGLAASPELMEIDATIDAQQRLLASARNALWAPTVALFSDLDYELAAGGAGSDPAAGLPPGAAVADDLDWSVGVSVSLPLLAGGARVADVSRVSRELESVRLRRAEIAQRVEQRIRSALHRAGASHANIQLARDAAAAARRSLELVTDAYSRGAARLVDLLDAQNVAVVSDLGAATAVYNFLIDFVDVERAVGCYQIFAGEDERRAFFERLDAYVRDADLGTPR